MGYLDNTTITVDAILTKKGRQLLASGRQNFNITKFALADDEVDYNLWNPAHPSGSNFYGIAIEEMPVLEPSADETQMMRYKLVSLPKDTVKIPVVSVFPTTISFRQGQYVDIAPNTVYSGGTSTVINLNATYGYTAILHNSDVATLSVTDAAPGGVGASADALEARLAIVQAQYNAEIDRARMEGGAPAVDSITQGALAEEIRSLNNRLAQARAQLVGVGSGMFLGDSEVAKSVFATGLKFRLTAKQLTSTMNTTITIIGNETGGSTTISVTNTAIKLTDQTT